MTLLSPLFGWDVVERIFSDRTRLDRMLDFEAALARAEAKTGVIPSSAAIAIAGQCRVELFDLDALGRAGAEAGNLAIPMVRQLTELVGSKDREAAKFVHWGATSQDAIDTGLVLQLRDALGAFAKEVERLCGHLAQLAASHRNSPVAARTWMQQAVPTVFGLKVAGSLDAMTRHRARLEELRARCLVLQFGGAAGTLASLEDQGLKVAEALADELHLSLPSMPWHSQRDRVAEVATTLALLTGTLGKMARDLALEMQTEIGEAAEPAKEGRGGSSTMPHKRNPVGCAVVLSAATRVPGLAATMLAAMTQEQERGLGGWHAEWETLSEIVRLSAGALHRMTETMAGLQVDPEAMRANLEVSHGLIYAEPVAMSLAGQIGKSEAHRLVETACRKAIAEHRHLRDVLAESPEIAAHLKKAEIEKLFDPAAYTGVALRFIDRVLAAAKESKPERI